MRDGCVHGMHGRALAGISPRRQRNGSSIVNQKNAVTRCGAARRSLRAGNARFAVFGTRSSRHSSGPVRPTGGQLSATGRGVGARGSGRVPPPVGLESRRPKDVSVPSELRGRSLPGHRRLRKTIPDQRLCGSAPCPARVREVLQLPSCPPRQASAGPAAPGARAHHRSRPNCPPGILGTTDSAASDGVRRLGRSVGESDGKHPHTRILLEQIFRKAVEHRMHGSRARCCARPGACHRRCRQPRLLPGAYRGW